jgi:hypothetical protein
VRGISDNLRDNLNIKPDRLGHFADTFDKRYLRTTNRRMMKVAEKPVITDPILIEIYSDYI